jgi:hypothetical protein
MRNYNNWVYGVIPCRKAAATGSNRFSVYGVIPCRKAAATGHKSHRIYGVIPQALEMYPSTAFAVVCDA